MVAIAERGEKMAVRKGYMNVWQTSLMEAVKADCSYCLLSAVCSQCVSFDLRKRALHNKMSRYVCCAGYMPCSGKCREDKCPTFCLCMEVFMIILGQLACICRLLACLTGNDELQEIAEILTCISDLVYCTVCACMQTQHKVELDHRHRMPGSGVMKVPAVQEMSRFDQPVPPNVTQPPQGQYPPQQGQWQPPPPPYGYAYPPGPPPPYMYGYHPNAMPPPGPYGGHPLPPGYHPGGQGYYPPNVPPQPQHFPSGEHPNNPPPPPAQKDSA
ncbi:hypothetical protein F3Y22_tig00110332pilonHSYRG01479 [Hibiscus syriacus]|uniref:PLAC8 family protein n=1 Tax=Hibiscus syriacus TaxID=106335 RepID=A0A6A3AY27_HIBSY|nr:hypothetical protein F3Y22_tig00110332pilonHSYRG01479 [Hibiscus syriacus]